MSDKTLKIRRVFANTIYTALRETPPKEYPTTSEIKSTINSVIPALREHISSYVDIMKKAEQISARVGGKEVSEEDAKNQFDELNSEFRKYNVEHGSELVEVALDEEAFKTLKMQFDRDNWGKKWVANIEEFGELEAAFAEAGK